MPGSSVVGPQAPVYNEEESIVHRLIEEKDTWDKIKFGNHKVFCGERVLVGPIRSWWWILEIYTILVTGVFIYENYTSIFLILCGLVGFLICMMSSWKTLFRNPGIVNRQPFDVALESAKKVEALMKSGIFYPSKTLSVRGQPVRCSYCLDCHVYRPPKTAHCFICDCCIEEYDHHCPVFGGCIGGKNILSFQCMAFSLSLYHCFLLFTGIYAVLAAANNGGVNRYDWWTISLTLDMTIVALSLLIPLPCILSNCPCEKDPPRRRTFNRWMYATNNYRRGVQPTFDQTSDEDGTNGNSDRSNDEFV